MVFLLLYMSKRDQFRKPKTGTLYRKQILSIRIQVYIHANMGSGYNSSYDGINAQFHIFVIYVVF